MSIESQDEEFLAVMELCVQWRRIQLTPVVDDDYPAVRHDYELAINNLLIYAVRNGRRLP